MALPTIKQRDEIAKKSQAAIGRVFYENGWGSPPTVTSGLVTEVLRATEQVTGEAIFRDERRTPDTEGEGET